MAAAPTVSRDSRFVILALTIVLAAVYARVVFGGQTFALDSDHLRFAIAARAQLAEALRSGRVPQWWDGVQLGVNVAAIPYFQSAYLPAWSVALFGAAYGTDALLVGHLLLGGIGLALWARRLGASREGALIGGALFMLGGYMPSMVVLHTAAMSPAWIPWVAWSADRLAEAASGGNRRSMVGAAAVTAMSMSMLLMSGDPSAAVSGALVGLLVAGSRAPRPLPALATETAALVVAVPMSAVVILPAVLYLPETDRSSWGQDPNVWLGWSLHPLSLLQLAWPRALGDPVEPSANLARIVANAARGTLRDPAWACSIHFGWIAMGLVACGAFATLRGSRLLAAGSLVVLLVAMGLYTPCYSWFRTVVLPERLLRYPARHFIAVVVIWSGLAAVGFDEALRPPRRKLVWPALLASLGVASAITILVQIAGTSLIQPLVESGPAFRRVEPEKVATAIVTGGASTIATLIGFACAVLAAGRVQASAWPYRLAATTIVLQLAVEAATLMPLVSREAVTADEGILGSVPHDLPVDSPRPRLYRDPSYAWSGPPPDSTTLARMMGRTAAENLGTLHGFAYAPGYTPAVSSARWNKVFQTGSDKHAILTMMDLFDIEYALMVAKNKAMYEAYAHPQAGIAVVLRDDADFLTIFHKAGVRPHAFVTSRWSSLDSDDAVIASMFGSSSDPSAIRFDDPKATPPEQSASGKSIAPCEVHAPRPERIDLRCSSDASAYAVLVDSWSPGWTASVDGAPVPVERADEVLRAVHVGPGDHHIVFTFDAPGFRAGAWVSLLTWLVAGLAVIPTGKVRWLRVRFG